SPSDLLPLNGGYGACGWQIQNGDHAVALGPVHWDSESYCGHTITAQYKGKSVTATVADLCPGCAGDHIDLTSSAMAVIDSSYINDRVITVNWHFN
ncbi:RlpA-like double-psi beta-barrel-protein domain-containing protein-containing protein, partial [Mycena rosella]